MYNLVLKFHQVLYLANRKHCYRKSNFLLYVLCNVGYRVCAMVLFLIKYLQQLLGFYPQPLSGDNHIIVSLTSFPLRIGKVWMVVDSMFYQQMPPDKVCLYLAKEEFPGGKASLPKRLLNYEKLGLEIKFVDVNLKPHNKYYFALQEFKDSYVITIDDDMYYHNNLIINLWETHLKNPDCVCANRMDVITFDENVNFMPYEKWKTTYHETKPSLLNVALGYEGILYPTKLFENADDMFNVDLITRLSPKADDLWLKALQLYYGIPVANGKYFCFTINLPGTQGVSLMASNCGAQALNDVQWKALVEYFNLKTLCFKLIQK